MNAQADISGAPTLAAMEIAQRVGIWRDALEETAQECGKTRAYYRKAAARAFANAETMAARSLEATSVEETLLLLSVAGRFALLARVYRARSF